MALKFPVEFEHMPCKGTRLVFFCVGILADPGWPGLTEHQDKTKQRVLIPRWHSFGLNNYKMELRNAAVLAYASQGVRDDGCSRVVMVVRL